MKILPNESVKFYDRLVNELGQYINEKNSDPYVRLSRLMTCLYDAYVITFKSNILKIF